AAATGAITFEQSGGGGVTFTGSVTTNDGAITLRNQGANNLTIGGSGVVNAGGVGSDVVLEATNGNIVLTGTTTALGDTVTVTATGSINGAGLVTAQTVDLNARTGIGNTTALELAASSISADVTVTGGTIDIDNALGTAVTVTSLTTVGTGAITFDQSGGGAVSFDGNVTTNNGAVTLTSTAGGLTIGDGLSVTAGS